MHTIFVINKSKNPGLFPQVIKAYDSSSVEAIAEKTLTFRDLLWRIVSHEEITAEIYGGPIQRLPQPLRLAVFQGIYMYDFIHEANFEEGLYAHLSAEAAVSVQSSGVECVYEVSIWGDQLAEMIELYHRLVDGRLSPYSR